MPPRLHPAIIHREIPERGLSTVNLMQEPSPVSLLPLNHGASNSPNTTPPPSSAPTTPNPGASPGNQQTSTYGNTPGTASTPSGTATTTPYTHISSLTPSPSSPSLSIPTSIPSSSQISTSSPSSSSSSTTTTNPSDPQLDATGGSPSDNQGTPAITSQSSSLTDDPQSSHISTIIPLGNIQVSSTSTHIGTSQSDLAAPTPTFSAAENVTSSHKLSSGAIASIVFVSLFFLIASIVLFIRRRSIALRIQHRKQWWSHENVISDNPDSAGIGNTSRHSQNWRPSNTSRASARSSFATHFDQGILDSLASSPSSHHAALWNVPGFPPTVQVHDNPSLLLSSPSPLARTQSVYSMSSNGSNSDTQYLIAPDDLSAHRLSSPMSVRPFTPSESFVFPKPPENLDSPISADREPAFSSNMPPTTLNASHPLSHPPGLLTAPNPSSNPFSNPAKPVFLDIETIRRPFVHALDDEISVCVNDTVRVVKVFDDGWAFVEKLCSSDRYQRGLIPVGCFSLSDQAPPPPLPDKRVSSYVVDTSTS